MEIMASNPVLVIMAALGIFSFSAYYLLATTSHNRKLHSRAEKIMRQYSKTAGIKGLKGLTAAQSAQAMSLKKVDKDMRLHGALRGLPSISRLRERLDRTGREISVGQYFKWTAMYGVGAFIAFHFMFGMGPILALLLGAFMGLMIPHILVGRMISKRLKKFLQLLPDALDLMVRGLRSGLPVTESINVIKDEIQEPVRAVFAEISQQVRIGVPFEEALMNTAQRLKINEFNFLVISIALQRETGGNLAEILDNLSVTIRARTMMKMKIKAITSEARMSAYIVGSLPFFVSAALSVMSPGYLAVLVDDVRGNIAFGMAACSFSFGMFIMFKMARFEI